MKSKYALATPMACGVPAEIIGASGCGAFVAILNAPRLASVVSIIGMWDGDIIILIYPYFIGFPHIIADATKKFRDFLEKDSFAVSVRRLSRSIAWAVKNILAKYSKVHYNTAMSSKIGKFLTTDEVARLFGVRPVTIYRKARSGEIPALKFGKSWIFSEDALHDWLKEQAAGKNRQDIILSLGPSFASIPEIQLVYLFGSLAAGLATPMSDIDIAYLDDGKSNAFDLEPRLEKVIFSVIPNAPRIDMVRLSTVSPVTNFKAIRDGRLIYKISDDVRAKFEENTFNSYLDYIPVLDNFYKEAA